MAPVRSTAIPMKETAVPKLSGISFFCPAYNDADNLPVLIPAVISFLESVAERYDVTIVEDGSPDATGSVADEIAATSPHVRVIHHRRNEGYGAALRTGFSAGRYPVVMYTDGDNQYDINELGPQLHELASYDILSGYRIERAGSLWRSIQSRAYGRILNLLFGTSFRDVDCSMKVYKREVLAAMPIRSRSAFIDAEILLRALRRGCRIHQFPVTHRRRVAGRESGSRLRVVLPTIVEMMKFRFHLL
jgi:glycosyltransferase involved in cell wall biosynthesis